MKHQVIALKKHSGMVKVDGIKFSMKLPTGCIGVLFCFESKKTAKEYWGEDVDLVEFEYAKKETV